VLAAILALPAAAAPSAPSARMSYGKPTVSWTIPPGSNADYIQFARSLPAEPNAFWRNRTNSRRCARASCRGPLAIASRRGRGTSTSRR
jgi:hypothetical protein